MIHSLKSSPVLTVIAGCNGSGKSSFSRAVTVDNAPAFDYDKIFVEHYNSLQDSDLRDVIAHNLSWIVLERAFEESLTKKLDFAYETNFHATPLFWPAKFKSTGFRIRLIYFCLNSIEEAKRRVQIRVENGGHFVPEKEIIERFTLGYKYLDDDWRFFDEVYLFDTSGYKESPKFILSIVNKKVSLNGVLPEFLNELIPNIRNFVIRQNL